MTEQRSPQATILPSTPPGEIPPFIATTMEKKYPQHPGLIAEEILSPQLATDPAFMMRRNEYDIRILTKLNSMEVLWNSIVNIIPDEAGGRAWKRFADEYKYHKRSEAGWNTQNILKALANVRGISAPREIVRKPNLLARNVWNRDWKERAAEEGKEVVQE